MDTLSKLLQSVKMSESAGGENSGLSCEDLDPASQNHNLMEKSKVYMHSQALQIVCPTSAEAHCMSKAKDSNSSFSLSKDPSRATSSPQNVSTSYGNREVFSIHESGSKIKTSEHGGKEKEHLEWQYRRNTLVDLDAKVRKNKLDALSSSSGEKLTSSNTDSQDVCSSSKTFEDNDISWLPPSLHNSGLARLAKKNLRPAALTGLQVPFLTSFKRKGYNSDGSSSTESSSSLSS